MVSAAHTVFNCTELLELILSFTSAADLLIIQRTCQRWKAVVEASNVLQRCLFFVPDQRGVEAYGLNPLLVQRFRFSREVTGHLCVTIKSEWRNSLLSCPNASWRRMLLSQPPEPFIMEEPLGGGSNKSGGFGDGTTCGDAWDCLIPPPEKKKEKKRGPTAASRRELWE